MIYPEPNVNLQPFNTLAVPSVAQYFYRAQSKEDLISAIMWAKKNRLEIKILGAGSNVLLGEKVAGLLVQPLIKGFRVESLLGLSGQELSQEGSSQEGAFQEGSSQEVLVQAGAGENWHELVEHCVNQSLYGLENLALIPGNVGSAPIQNIGAYGVELNDVFVSLRALNIESLETEEFDIERCQFGYRDSVFKREANGEYIILEVSLRLSRRANVKVDYPALKSALQDAGIKTPTPRDVFNAVVKVRSEKLPDPLSIPNAGSFFKNPVVSRDQFIQIEHKHPEVVHYVLESGDVKLAAAWLIDQAGWKGRMLEGVGVHDKQALVLVNPNKEPVSRIMRLAEAIEKSVWDKFLVRLEIEPRVLA
ncbi:UDP-N-acetylenolpyruvoylglucosamine reductase [Thalassocella blandensis]|nr:UDP-N-acetylenolpyruvoylglucosamine reductase [Thalassocella blandensis]